MPWLASSGGYYEFFMKEPEKNYWGGWVSDDPVSLKLGHMSLTPGFPCLEPGECVKVKIVRDDE